jgi:cell division protein FtsB
VELEAQHSRLRELTDSKKQLELEVSKLKEQQGILKTEAESRSHSLWNTNRTAAN